MPPPTRWKPEQDSLLIRCYRDPRISKSQIARMLGCTKNAVVGRAHRLGLTLRASNDNCPLITLGTMTGKRCLYDPTTRIYRHWDELGKD